MLLSLTQPLTDVNTNVNPDRAHRKKRRNHLTLPQLAAALDQASQLPVLTTNPWAKVDEVSVA